MRQSAFSVLTLTLCCFATATPAWALYDVIVEPSPQTFGAGTLQTSPTGDYDGGPFYYHPNWGNDTSSASAMVRYILPTLPAGERRYNIYAWNPLGSFSADWRAYNVNSDGLDSPGSSPWISWGGMFGTNAQWLKLDGENPSTPKGAWVKLGAGPQADIANDGGRGVYMNPAHQIPGSGVFTKPEIYLKYQSFYDKSIAFTAIRVVEIPEPGDFNTDGYIDGQDFLEWQRGNSPNPLSSDDLATWEAGFGSAAAAANPVPEPATAALALVAVGALLGAARAENSRRGKRG